MTNEGYLNLGRFVLFIQMTNGRKKKCKLHYSDSSNVVDIGGWRKEALFAYQMIYTCLTYIHTHVDVSRKSKGRLHIYATTKGEEPRGGGATCKSANLSNIPGGEPRS